MGWFVWGGSGLVGDGVSLVRTAPELLRDCGGQRSWCLPHMYGPGGGPVLLSVAAWVLPVFFLASPRTCSTGSEVGCVGGVPGQAPGGGPGWSSRSLSGSPLDVCQFVPARITTTLLSPGAPKSQACESVDNGGTVLAGSGPQSSNSAVLVRGTNIVPWDLLPRPGCGLVLPARNSTALDFTLMRTYGALRLFSMRIFRSSSVTATRPTAPDSHGQNSSTPAAPIGMPYPLQLDFVLFTL